MVPVYCEALDWLLDSECVWHLFCNLQLQWLLFKEWKPTGTQLYFAMKKDYAAE